MPQEQQSRPEANEAAHKLVDRTDTSVQPVTDITDQDSTDPRRAARNTVQYATPPDLPAGLRRRREAALRLPPLPCGCRDPLSHRHRAGRCRWQGRAA